MTSQNVSSIPIQVTPSGSPQGKPEAMQDGEVFQELMSKSMSRAAQAQPVMPQNDIRGSKAGVKVDCSREPVRESMEKRPVNEKAVTEAEEKVEEFSEETEELLVEELEVPKEEVEKVLEELGYTFLDLTNPTVLAEVVGKLEGCEDTVELLLNQDFNGILTQVKELAAGLKEATGLSLNELKELMAASGETAFQTEAVTEVPEMTSEGVAAENGMSAAERPVENGEEPGAGKQPEVVLEKPVQTVETETETEADIPKEGDVTEAVSRKKETTDASDSQNEFSENRDSGRMMGMRENGQLHQVIHTQTTSFEAVTQTITMESGETVSAARIIEQLVEQVRTVFSEQMTTMEMVLHPEGLGKIFMQVSEQEGNVTARLFTQNEAVKEALESQMVVLREQMEQSGTKVDAIEVSVEPHAFERNLEEGQQEPGGQQDNHPENKRQRSINLNQLDELSGLMTEEEELVAKIMRDHGNSVNYTA